MPITYRRATIADDFTTYTIFRESIADFGQRTGVTTITGATDAEHFATLWERRQPLWAHLSQSSDQYWLAEAEDGTPIGYARSIRRGDHRELTEFFVLPGNQSAGIGKELLSRVFPHDTPHRMIIATPDLRAMARYLKAGVYPFTTIIYFERTPQAVGVETDLEIVAIDSTTDVCKQLNELDREAIGFEREIDHAFLRKYRSLFLYRHQGKLLGYGYAATDYCGPFTLRESRYFPAVLAHAESYAHASGANSVGFEVPALNTDAVDYLLTSGYRLEGFLCSLMTNKPFGNLQHYICASPLFFL